MLSPSEPGYPGYADYRAVRATWGAPARVYRVGQDTIWYWPQKNLLSSIRQGTVMRIKYAIALVPLLIASGVLAGCDSGASPAAVGAERAAAVRQSS